MDIGLKERNPRALEVTKHFHLLSPLLLGSGEMENSSDLGDDMYLAECAVLAENILGLKSARLQLLFLLDFCQTPALIATNVDRVVRPVAAFGKDMEVMVFHEPTELDQSYSDLYKKSDSGKESMKAMVGGCQRRLGQRQLHSNWTGMIL
jgi:hypothetical protein